MSETIIGGRGGLHPLARFVNHIETYGPHIMRRFLQEAAPYRAVLDVGAGQGRDLGIAAEISPEAQLYAIEFLASPSLSALTASVHPTNIETEQFPFGDSVIDVVIANQVLEHAKEIFWIFHEISRVVRVGGHVIIGTPNVLSLHNRLLALAGKHPTQHKLCSAHVRVFSDPDFRLFLNTCWHGGYSIKKFAGSQFYPLPAGLSRLFSGIFPNAAFSVFWLLEKRTEYSGEFLQHPIRAHLETNFYTGPHTRSPSEIVRCEEPSGY